MRAKRRPLTGLLVAILAACGTSTTQPEPDAWAPRYYEGYIAIGPDWVDIFVRLMGDTCICDGHPAALNECVTHDDVGFECNAECRVCEGDSRSITVTSDSGESLLNGYRGTTIHGSAPGETITITLRGCLGTVVLEVPVPDRPPVDVGAPTDMGTAGFEITWTPNGSMRSEARQLSAGARTEAWPPQPHSQSASNSAQFPIA